MPMDGRVKWHMIMYSDLDAGQIEKVSRIRSSTDLNFVAFICKYRGSRELTVVEYHIS